MKKKNRDIAASGEGSPVIEGLAEATSLDTKRDLAERLAALQQTKAKAVKAAKAIEGRRVRMSDLANGTNEAGKNPRLRHNPQVDAASLRPSEDGELVNGKPAKGWVVEIACEVCDTVRLVNTQDAFQVRFCEEHKDEARKAASKARRAGAAVAKLEALDEDVLRAQIEELEAVAA